MKNVWLNRHQIATLFGRDVKTIGKHINNALREELAELPVATQFAHRQNMQDYSVVANFATTAADGKVYRVEYYNLDVILSVGYRVKSTNGIKFRAWANQVLKTYLWRGYAINRRFERLEYRMAENERNIDLILRTELPPTEGIFYDGQIFDAYKFVSDLIVSAKRAIVVIDNYVDASVLTLMTKRRNAVKATILTQTITPALQLDLQRYNAQYSEILIKKTTNIHDRFLLIDNEVYHIGASLKDLGKKLFAFSKLELPANDLLANIEKCE